MTKAAPNTRQSAPKSGVTFDSYLNSSIVEYFSTTTYTVFDHADDDNYIYVHHDPVHDDWAIERSSFPLTEEERERVFDKVFAFVQGEKEQLPGEREKPWEEYDSANFNWR